MKGKAGLFLFGTTGIIIFPQKKRIPSSILPSPFLLCLRYAMVFLLFQASEAQAELRRRMEDLNRWRIFILGMEREREREEDKEEVEEEGGTTEGSLIISSPVSAALPLCALVSCLTAGSLCRWVAC